MLYINYGLSFFATIMLVIGVIALLTNLGILSAVIWKWWPVLLIIFAIFLFAIKKKKKKIIAGHLLSKLTNDDRVHDKIKKVIDIVEDAIDKKLDEWHGETTKSKKSRRK